MLNRSLAAPVFLLAACTVPARESAPPARADTPPVQPTDTAPVAAVVAADPVSAAHAEASSPTRALFLANCAQCHGEKGDGEGVTQLDRKARSFLDGGFSYGNTKDAILRSITHGIPGTPMPPFEKALSEAQCVDLAEYVIAFGPDQIVVDPSESEMVVKDRPLVVYGKLPAIVEGAPEYARGLAIGTPDGLTFEYRVDDVQLIGVRAGRFLNRSDWGERGGTALEMLGKVVWTAGPGAHPIRFRNGADTAAVCRLVATEIEPGGTVRIEYVALLVEDPSQSVIVIERVSGFACELGSGFVRRLSVRGSSENVRYRIVLDERENATHRGMLGSGNAGNHAFVHAEYGTSGELIAIITDPTVEVLGSDENTAFLAGTEQKHVDLVCIPVASIPADFDTTSDKLLDIVKGMR